MSAVDSSQPTGRHRRSSRCRVQAIEYRRRAVQASESATGTASYVGRVGALAVALGVGSAVAAMPVALADTTGSAGSTASSADTASASDSAPKSKPSRAGSRSAATRGGARSSGTTSSATSDDLPALAPGCRASASPRAGVPGGSAAVKTPNRRSNSAPEIVVDAPDADSAIESAPTADASVAPSPVDTPAPTAPAAVTQVDATADSSSPAPSATPDVESVSVPVAA